MVVMNIVCFLLCYDMDVFVEILKGGFDKVKESGVFLVGGYIVDDKEFKYGFLVFGIVSLNKVLLNVIVKFGDKLIIIKLIGVGVLNIVMKEGMVE